MKALEMTYSIPRYVVSKAVGRLVPQVYTSPLGLLRLRDVPPPALPGASWCRLDVRYGGICGSDMHAVHLESSMAMMPLVSFPFVPGHEITGTVTELGSAVRDLKVGERVVVDPVLSCLPRGVTPACRSCQQGRSSLCESFTRGLLPPGISIGSCRATGGGWGESLVAHESQLLPLPDAVSDEQAVLLEPLAVALHAILRRLPADHESIIVAGAGSIGLCVIAALRGLGVKARIIALYRHGFQGDLARSLGADDVIQVRGQEHYRAVARTVGGQLHYPPMGKPVLVGGADIVYECVGTDSSVDDALRLTRSGGDVILVGLVGTPSKVDWTPIWLNEINLAGAFWASTETLAGRRQRTFQLAIDLVAQGKVNLSSLLTHRFRLQDYRKALAAVQAKGQSGVVKAVFDHRR